MDILLNSEGHIDVSRGTLTLIQDRDLLVAQRLTVRLRTYAKEWFLDQNMGVAWFTDILLKNVPRGTVDQIIQEELTKDPMVESVLSFSGSVNVNRVYECDFRVKVVGLESSVRLKYLANENGVFLTDEKGNLIQLEA